MKILIIIPVFNEEPSLPGVLRTLVSFCPDADVVVIDDASQDASAKVATDIGTRVVPLPINLGIGGAVKTGYKLAADGGYDVAVQFDGDGQHRAEEIQRLVEPILHDQADMVIGSRFIDKTGYQSDADRRLGIRFFSTITSALTGTRITDVTSGFRAIGPRLIRLFARSYPVEFPDAEAIILAVRAGMRVREISVTMNPRLAGRSAFSLLKKLDYPLRTFVSIAATTLRSRSG